MLFWIGFLLFAFCAGLALSVYRKCRIVQASNALASRSRPQLRKRSNETAADRRWQRIQNRSPFPFVSTKRGLRANCEKHPSTTRIFDLLFTVFLIVGMVAALYLGIVINGYPTRHHRPTMLRGGRIH